MPASLFPFLLCSRRAIYFHCLAFVGLFLYHVHASMLSSSIYCIAVPQAQHGAAQSSRTKPQSKYMPIRVRQRKQADIESVYCIAVPKAQHSTAQHSTAQHRNHPAQSRKASTRVRPCNASRQSWREPGRIYDACRILHAEFSKRATNQNLPGLRKYTTAHTALV